MSDIKIFCYEKLYYDFYEFYGGDGFFPILKKDETCNSEEDIIFYYVSEKNCWQQINGICISGLDCDEGKKLLNRMNTKQNVLCNSILNSFGNNLYPKN